MCYSYESIFIGCFIHLLYFYRKDVLYFNRQKEDNDENGRGSAE